MDSPTYIANAIRTESVPESVEVDQLFLSSLFGMVTSLNVIVDQAKRKIFYGAKIDENKMLQATHTLEGFAGFVKNAVAGNIDIGTPMTDEEMAEGKLPEYLAKMDLKNINIRLLHAAMGCFTESSELMEAVEKQYRDGELDLTNFGEEIGDIEWYQAIGFDATGVTEASCREKNIAKLRARYPEKFDADQAVNRDLDAERNVLESPSAEHAAEIYSPGPKKS